jgi:hypothetical protein
MSPISKPFQRLNSISNAHVGSEFELTAYKFFLDQKIILTASFNLPIGVKEKKKNHAFDLGCANQKILVECKSHCWTNGSNVPSAKLTVWNEAMYYFHLAPGDYRKIMFVLKHYCERRHITLAQYYLDNFKHLIPAGVEFFEYDEGLKTATELATS